MTATRHTGQHRLNGLVRDLPAGLTTLDLIEQRVERHPEQLAISYGEQALSYRQLSQKANELAARYLEHGACAERLLPLLVTDGLELPLAILAAMKAGVPFVPMDPRWPAERISALLALLDTDLLVVGPRTEPSVCALGTPVLASAADLAGRTTRPATPRAGQSDVCYGFFTSGTTGLPKCTLNHHLGLLNRFTTMTRLFGEGHVALQNSKSVFDSSLWQLLWPLTSGGRVVMPIRSGLLDLEQTVRQIGAHQVSITDFVPSIFAVLADLVHADAQLARSAASLRRVLIGGEAINLAAVRRFHEVLPHVAFTNTYGPTEASIGSVFHSFTEPPPEDAEVPIGCPIDNTAVVVVDSELRRLGPGETGELLIGGVCVGHGYLGDPTRTARAFIPNPFPDVLGDRLYRTGDLGQHREDGLFYFVGRMDDQIKLRGVRIEPREVEDALLRLPGVREVKVLMDGELDGAQLIAAVVGEQLDIGSLPNAARAVLPPELLPDRFVELDRIPLSANGKADRRALAELIRGQAGSPTALLDGMLGRVERQWAEVLPIAGGDPDASFFDLGGTSLSAQRLALALRAEFDRPVTVHDIAHHPTMRAQADWLSGPADGGWGEIGQLLADQQLDDWAEHRPAPPARPHDILLTGASGFIGCHLLAALLATGVRRVRCLIRAADRSAAERLLASRLAYYRLPDLLADPRVEVEPGDLGSPRLGLSAARFAELADGVEAIVHGGAQVNLVLPYSQLRDVNVNSVRAVIELARRGRSKWIHQLSTLSVLPAGAAVDEDTCLVESQLPSDGYSQSKWCAEQLLATARGQGLSVSIYRLGEVMPDSRTGVASFTGSLTELLLAGCRQLGLVTHTGAAADFTPVDVVAEFLARAVTEAGTAEPRGGCYHVVAPRHLALDRVLGQLQLEEVAYPEFRQRVVAAAAAPDAPLGLGKLALVLPERPAAGSAPLSELFFTSTSPNYRDRFAARCAELGFDWPEVDERMLAAWCGNPDPLPS